MRKFIMAALAVCLIVTPSFAQRGHSSGGHGHSAPSHAPSHSPSHVTSHYQPHTQNHVQNFRPNYVRPHYQPNVQHQHYNTYVYNQRYNCGSFYNGFSFRHNCYSFGWTAYRYVWYPTWGCYLFWCPFEGCWYYYVNGFYVPCDNFINPNWPG